MFDRGIENPHVIAGILPLIMLRISKGPEGPVFISFSLSGRIQAEHKAELGALLEGENRTVILDLKEVTLVSCDAVRFLGACESRGAELRNCPAYVRRWISREQCDATDTTVAEKEQTSKEATSAGNQTAPATGRND